LGESVNAKLQNIKAQVCGDRNRQRFRDAIMFRLGADSMYIHEPHQPARIPETAEISVDRLRHDEPYSSQKCRALLLSL
jgi:hypothetical protein